MLGRTSTGCSTSVPGAVSAHSRSSAMSLLRCLTTDIGWGIDEQPNSIASNPEIIFIDGYPVLMEAVNDYSHTNWPTSYSSPRSVFRVRLSVFTTANEGFITGLICY